MSCFRILTVLVLFAGTVKSQELYVFSEPASNMPAKSIGVRMTNEGQFNSGFNSRTIPEVMFGFNKNLMAHAQGFFSDMDGRYKFEGGSIYAKYRFLSVDDLKSHIRAAAFGRYSRSNRRAHGEDVNLEGDNSGLQGGIIVTQLIHKLALSATLSYAKVLPERLAEPDHGYSADQMLGYSLSSGYLLLPFVYKDYNQPNFNLYVELLGKTNPTSGHSYIDLAPAVQVVLSSRTRLDLGYRFELSGNMENRYLKNMYLARVEFNFFNALK
ncbi:MAG: hypothetical protein EOO88_57015 [Pedobacter sp.]|nr:MAG: hypothetical protein EOO88_57015 [Pedobacter sp.]